jgi:hypothetical protein
VSTIQELLKHLGLRGAIFQTGKRWRIRQVKVLNDVIRRVYREYELYLARDEGTSHTFNSISFQGLAQAVCDTPVGSVGSYCCDVNFLHRRIITCSYVSRNLTLKRNQQLFKTFLNKKILRYQTENVVAKHDLNYLIVEAPARDGYCIDKLPPYCKSRVSGSTIETNYPDRVKGQHGHLKCTSY